MECGNIHNRRKWMDGRYKRLLLWWEKDTLHAVINEMEDMQPGRGRIACNQQTWRWPQLKNDTSMPGTILSGLNEVLLSDERSYWRVAAWNTRGYAVTNEMEDMQTGGEDVNKKIRKPILLKKIHGCKMYETTHQTNERFKVECDQQTWSGVKEIAPTDEKSWWRVAAWNARGHAVTNEIEDMQMRGEDVRRRCGNIYVREIDRWKIYETTHLKNERFKEKCDQQTWRWPHMEDDSSMQETILSGLK